MPGISIKCIVSTTIVLIMSHTFTLQSTSNILQASYYPPIDVSDRKYCLALIGLHTYNTIPNIEEGFNKFYYNNNQVITIPTGIYEISDIEKYLRTHMQEENISLKANNNTIKCELKCNFDVDFKPIDSIGKLLGFSGRQILKAKQLHVSDLPVSIIKVTSIRVECNIISGAYYDNKLSHTLFEFSPQTDPGCAIVIEPRNHIYLPVNTNSISSIILRLVDQDGDLVNFRGEKVLIRLELKQWD